MNINNKNINNSSSLHFILILAIVFMAPMIVRMAIVQTNLEISNLMFGMEQNYDFYSYYKANFFVVLTMLSVSFLIYYQWKNRIPFKRTKSLIPMLIYSMTLVISSVMAKNNNIAFIGTIDRYEGFYVLLSYLLVSVICLNTICGKSTIRLLLVVLCLTTTIICLIGLFQLLGYDLFKSEFGLKLIIPKKYHEIIENVNFNFNRTYTTLQNPNYVGSFMSMTSMIGLTFLIFAKDVSAKLFATLILILSLTNLFGSMSRGGFVGLSAALLLLIIIAVRQDLKGRIIIISSITVIIAVFIGVDAIFGGLMSSRLKSMVQLEKQDNSAALIIIPEGDKLLVTSDDDKSYLVCVDNQFEFMDSNTNVIETVEADGKYKLAGDKHESLTFYYVVYENLPGINIKQNNIDINIIKLGDQYKILNPVGQFVDIEKIESWGFEGYEKIGSSRGYIWSRTIPLLKYNILFGQGPDTYALAFPQNDVFGKAIAFNDPWIVVDKPHNMYLQMGVNTGVISMLAFIAMYMIYFIQSIPLYFKGKLDNFLKISGAAFLLATFAYMITGFFNDSVVSVAPVFWILLGSGIGINLKLKEDIKVKDARVAVAGN